MRKRITALLVCVFLIFVSGRKLIPTLDPYFHIQSDSGAYQQVNNNPVSTSGPLLVFNLTFGGPYEDWSEQIIECSLGGFAIVASTQNALFKRDVWLLRVDANGNLLWNQTYGSQHWNDEGHSIIECSDGGFAIAGFKEIAGDYYGWLIRTDANGEHLWNKTYGTGNDDFFESIIKPSEGGLLLCGTTSSWGAGQGDGWLLRTDNNGNQLWQQTYGSPLSESGRCVIESRSGGFAFIGGISYADPDENDIWLVGTDLSGNPLWNHTYHVPGHESATDFIEIRTGGFATVGQTDSNTGGLINGYLLRTDAAGVLLWDMVISDGTLWSICEPLSGGLITTGRQGTDLQILRTDPAGTILWDKVYDGTEIDAGHSVIECDPNTFMITGRTNGTGMRTTDVWLLKILEPSLPSLPPILLWAIPIGLALGAITVIIFLVRKRKLFNTDH
jgi:hypothetical protein